MPQKQRQKLWTQILDQAEKDLELVKTLIRVLSAWISVVSIFILECVNMRLEHALYGTDGSYIEFVDVLSWIDTNIEHRCCLLILELMGNLYKSL